MRLNGFIGLLHIYIYMYISVVGVGFQGFKVQGRGVEEFRIGGLCRETEGPKPETLKRARQELSSQ